jgi:hypothetical protein
MIDSFLIYAWGSMIIHDFYILSVPHHPPKTDAPLVVDSYTHLACSLSFQQFRAISRRVTQVLDGHSSIQLIAGSTGSA